jgi:hypothetical protein
MLQYFAYHYLTEVHVNLPTSFELRRHKWTVELVEEAVDMDRDHGHCYSETKTIEIWGGLGPARRLRVFLHEYLHAVEVEYCIKIPHWLIYRLEVPLARIVSTLIQYNSGPAGFERRVSTPGAKALDR